MSTFFTKLFSIRKTLMLFITVGLAFSASQAYANKADEKLVAQAEEFQKGFDAAQKGKLENALQTWQALYDKGELIPELNRALENNIAVVLMKQKRYDEAKKRLDSALKADAQVATTLANLNQLHAYDAQKAYQKIFKKTTINKPQGELLYFDVKRATLPTDRVITDERYADASRVVGNKVQQWREAWSKQNIKQYLSYYDKVAFIPKDGLSYKTWEKSRYSSLQRPKFIKVELTEIEISAISPNMMRVRFLQKYHSDRFKDDVYKILLWQKHNGQWKIVQEVVMYDGH